METVWPETFVEEASLNQMVFLLRPAVLPLANLSSDLSQEYFADGITEALICRTVQNRHVIRARTCDDFARGAWILSSAIKA